MIRRGLAAVALLLIAIVPAQAQELVAIDGDVAVKFSGLVLNRATNSYDTSATIRNVSSSPMFGPLSLVITSVTPGSVGLAIADGLTPAQQAFVNVPLPVGGLAPGQVAANVVLKFANPSRVRFTFTASVVAGRMPSSQDLIDAAVTAGRIDYPTSLLYRAYALFGDARLPEEFEGGGSTGEDLSLFFEIRDLVPTLPPATRALLEAFLLRPGEPGSAFGPPAFVPATRSRLAAAAATSTECPTFWLGLTFPNGHFRAHVCVTSNAADDQKVLGDVLAMADTLWEPMTKDPPEGMGKPKPDTLGGDDKIDIYLLAADTCRPRGNRCFTLASGKAIAMAIPAEPFELNAAGQRTASGYILLKRAQAADPAQIKSDFAHEFFHVLQFAHNAGSIRHNTGKKVGNKPSIDWSWFVEASATWAESRYVPESAGTEVHQRWFVADFQHRGPAIGLQSIVAEHEYAAYIWALFMQQEQLDQAVFKAWVAIESAADLNAIDDAIDQQVSFESRFRDFAVRNINTELDAAISPLYQAVAASLPKDSPPDFTNQGVLITLAVTPPTTVKIAPLAAQYDDFPVAPDVRLLAIDVSNLGPTIELDVLALIRDEWKRFSPSGQRLEFCRDVPEEAVDRVIIVVSNHARATQPDSGTGLRSRAPVEGAYTIDRASACGRWSGTVTFTFRLDQHSVSDDGITRITRDFVQRQEQSFTLLPATTVVEPVGNDGDLQVSIRATQTVAHHGSKLDIEQHRPSGCIDTHDVTQEGTANRTIDFSISLMHDGTYVFGAVDLNAGSVQVTQTTHSTESCSSRDETTVQILPLPVINAVLGLSEGELPKVDPFNLSVLSGHRTVRPSPDIEYDLSWNLRRDNSPPTPRP